MNRGIEARDLTKTYPGGVRALDGLGFEVEAGTVFGLLGPNGAGKSTAVKVLSTLARPDDGRASVAGLDVRRQTERVRRVIGVVGQRSGVDPDATGRENLSLQARIHGLGRSETRRRVEELLGDFGLAPVADRPARTYSGGMQRRLDIAIGLVHRPAVLFLDEPTTGLDPEVRADMWSLITGLTRDEGLTILLTTHYLEEADQLAARMAIVERGRVVVEGSPEALKAELRGDTVQISLVREANGHVGGALAGLAGVRETVQDGRIVRARVDEGATAVPTLLAALESVGEAVASVSVSRPSLDDVYLRHVGRTFAEASDSPEGGPA